MNNIGHEMANQQVKIKRAEVVNIFLFVGGIAALISGSSGHSEAD